LSLDKGKGGVAMVAVGGDALSKVLGLILLVVCLPIFAVQYTLRVLCKTLGMLSAEKFVSGLKVFFTSMWCLSFLSQFRKTASAGIVSMGDIIIQFMPIFGIGAEIMGIKRILIQTRNTAFSFKTFSHNRTTFSLLAGFGLVTRR